MEEKETDKGWVKTKYNIMLNGVPADVMAELDRRSDAHFRSRTGEILSILTTVCRNKLEFSDLPIDGGTDADGAAQDEPGAAQDGPQSTGDGQGGE